MKRLIQVLTSELIGCKAILDVGVGTGRFAEPLQNAGFEVVGVDISKKMIAKAKEKRVHDLILAHACYLPFKDSVFDSAVSVHILHLISQWNTALQEICRVTKRFMVSTYHAKEDPIRQDYNDLLKKYGYERRRVGKSEQELSKIVIPIKSVFVTSYSTSADDHLNNMWQGTSSSQWQIPTDVNRKVVDELRGKFAGRTFPQELRLLIWDINDVKAYGEKANI